jgi:hypothetical protein
VTRYEWSVWAGRFPGRELVRCRVEVKPSIRLFMRMPCSGTQTRLPQGANTDWIHEMALPWPSMARM